MILPFDDTEAMEGSLEDHVIALFLAFFGKTDAYRAVRFPSFTSKWVLLSLTCVTARDLTVTVHCAMAPLEAMAVMTVVPGVAPYTWPLAVTDATAGLLDDQTMVLLAGEFGVNLV